MRVTATAGDFEAFAIAGTRTILIAVNCPEAKRKGLLGFGFKRQKLGGDPATKWLRSHKVFKSVEPNPDPRIGDYRTNVHPVQDFYWSDYTADPGTGYRFEIHPMYGAPTLLEPAPPVIFEIVTEPEMAGGHGIWFNRGAIASQFFAREFGNVKPTRDELEDVNNPKTKWLSRGLLEACLGYIGDRQPKRALRAGMYEFTFKPILNAFRQAIEDGVDVELSVHDTPANRDAIEAAGLREKENGKTVIHWRTVPKIPHNKFIVELLDGEPRRVWTGSTNITPSGFLGQSNAGHLVEDAGVATKFLDYWKVLAPDPSRDAAREAVMDLSPHPPHLPDAGSISTVFSPRPKSDMLDWYADRIADATGCVMFTAAFGVNEKLRGPLAKDRDFLRFVLMEKSPTKEEKAALSEDRDLRIAFGAILGSNFRIKDGEAILGKIPDFGLDRWFIEEEHFRKQGNVFFVHTKYMLIDPLGDDPLVCAGSANFSGPSLLQNDENMLLIRGDTRVADIYYTEFDRLFRHFFFRDVANEIERKGGDAKDGFLAEDDSWSERAFKDGTLKSRQRELYFKKPAGNWTDNAAARMIG